MRKGWEIKKIKDVCLVIAGQSPEGKFYNDNGNGLAFYQGKKEFTEKYIGKPTTWTTAITKEAEKGDILMSVRAPVGPINFATQKICIGRGLAAIRASKLIEREYLFNFLLKLESEIVGNTGAVFNSINKAQIENILIPIPSLIEQQQIVSILDEAFAAIDQAKENLQRNLQNAKELFQSELNNIFKNKGDGWVEKKFGNCFKLKSGNMMTSKMMKTDGKYSVYGGNGISGRHDSYNLSGENIIIGRVGALCGNVRMLKEKIWLTDNAFQIVDFQFDFDYSFLTYLLNYKDLRSAARQSAQPVISNSSLKDMPLQFPVKVQEQKKIVQQLDSLSTQTKNLEKIYQQKLDNLEELKKSILEKAFSAELILKQPALT